MKKLFPLILTLMFFSISCCFTGLDPYDDEDDYYGDYDDEKNILYFKIDGFGIEGEPTFEIVTAVNSVITEIKLSGIERGNKITALGTSNISTASVGVLRESVLNYFQGLYPVSSARAVLDTDRYISRNIFSRDIIIINSVGSKLYDNYKIKSGDELMITVSIPLKDGIRIEGNDYLIITIIANT